MPLQDHMQLISTDDHLIEHPMLWQDRLPAKYRDVGPRIIEKQMPRAIHAGDGGRHDGGTKIAEVWQYEGRIYPYIGLNAVAGKKPEEYGAEPTRYEEMIPGCYEPVARLRDMDVDGVHATLSFPSFPRFAGTVFLEGEDKELALLCVRAWNDYVLDEWCPTDPERLIPLVILPLWDIEASVAEVHRTAAKGARTVSFVENPHPLGLPSFHTDHWDPVFRAVTETQMPLCVHFGTSGKPPITAPEAPMAVMTALFGCNSMYATADLLFSPTFHKHPELKFMLSEGGIGWVPYMLERMDGVWAKHRYYQNINPTVKPSELFAKHIFGCFIDDEFGVDNRHLVGIDNITWEGDYPHSDSNWPNSRKIVHETMLDVPDEDVHKMVELNARRLLNFPRAGV
ncbi:amidohydrolase family protein [Gordonia amarae]|uniref:Amidohydrolase family protein n=2 Tax=Gordonia amarae TaxID=36821 RepID=A0A857LRE4_9ACTN|nr:amidohydrolase family protein [Gordonia amarae]MCS3880467.1 putative TIM-barrel fold metal-dependent hydrolase [Gordonia amarae]QHN18798.1 amidohydrolase family protein [Gordonia amarae]QHN23273.1 amidohydrolase family protein [Gordonia amarae]QHN32174.1 amidohydrolase family protein [Gordonia amarae]QHN40921.1 amidohydrolase family protein [Gordonia amarae]